MLHSTVLGLCFPHFSSGSGNLLVQLFDLLKGTSRGHKVSHFLNLLEGAPLFQGFEDLFAVAFADAGVLGC